MDIGWTSDDYADDWYDRAAVICGAQRGLKPSMQVGRGSLGHLVATSGRLSRIATFSKRPWPRSPIIHEALRIAAAIELAAPMPTSEPKEDQKTEAATDPSRRRRWAQAQEGEVGSPIDSSPSRRMPRGGAAAAAEGGLRCSWPDGLAEAFCLCGGLAA